MDEKPFGDGRGHVAVIQLRGSSRDKLSEALRLIRQEARGDFSKLAVVRGGYDAYINSRGVFNRLTKLLQRHFWGQTKLSTRLFSKSRQTGKELHRTSLLFTILPFSKGDIIEYKEDAVRLGAPGKNLVGVSLSSGRRVELPLDGQYRKLEVLTLHISQKKPEIRLIHPESYQPVAPENPPRNRLEGETCRAVVIGERIFLL